MSRVLLIDDDQHFLIALPAVFTRSPCVITADTASTAEQALRLVEVTEYDTIVSDFSMPGLSGTDVAHEVARIRPELPVILTSGYAARAGESLAAPSSWLRLDKPFDRRALSEALSRALRVRAAG